MPGGGFHREPPVRRVLVVDDSREDRDAVIMALRADRQVRHQFTEAGTGAEGLRAFADAAWPFDLLVLGWRLSDMDAVRFVAELQGDAELPPVPVIVLTDSHEESPYDDLILRGVQDFFTKSTLTSALLSRIAHNAIERHELLNRLVASEQAAEIDRLRAEDANRAKSQFLTVMSHELRTPLTGILGLTDLLRKNPDSPEAREMLDMIAASGSHLAELLDDLLDIAKIEAGTLDIELVECDLHELLGGLCDLMSFRAQDDGLLLDLKLSDDVPQRVCTDTVRLRQILTNLLSNAIKFTDSGSIRIDVSYRRSEPPHQLVVRVVDTGRGIDSASLETIFNPFVQADQQSEFRRTGVGLGLPISRRLAQMMGGDLVVERTSPSGSTFRLTIAADEAVTACRDDASEPAEGECPSTSGDPQCDLHGYRLLLAEDTRANQFLIQRMIESVGGALSIASDGQEAIEKVLAASTAGPPYDLVLMDMQMPRLNGFAATRQLRAEGFTRPIVAITAAALPADRQRCLDAGCDEVLTKPIDYRLLVETLQRLLSGG